MLISFNKRVVIDLDNTLIDYGHVFLRYAIQHGWVEEGFPASKDDIRRWLFENRPMAKADHDWQALQCECYTRGIQSARIDPIAIDCIKWLQGADFEVFILSHKSAKSNFDRVTDLRQPALDFLSQKEILNLVGRDSILFTESFEEKVETLEKLNPCLIIDDLEKLIQHPRLLPFNRIHFANCSQTQEICGSNWFTVFSIVRAIASHFPFKISALCPNSKNQILLLEKLQEKKIIKIFGPTEFGEQAAIHEAKIFGALRGITSVCLPGFLGRHGNVIVMEYLQNSIPCSDEYAYEKLLQFLQETKDTTCDTMIPDDASTKEEYLKNLTMRLARNEDFSLRFDWIKIFEEMKKDPNNDFLQHKRLFLLSDFHPNNTLQVGKDVYFIDLEHAGMGNPARFLCNLLLHPQSKITNSAWEKIREYLDVKETVIRQVFPFSFLEWILIVWSREKSHALAKQSIDFYFSAAQEKQTLFDYYRCRRFGL